MRRSGPRSHNNGQTYLIMAPINSVQLSPVPALPNLQTLHDATDIRTPVHEIPRVLPCRPSVE